MRYLYVMYQNSQTARMTHVFLLVLFVLLEPGLLFAQRQIPTAKEKAEAEHVWEQLIIAKGGRNRLHAITNMMLTKGNKPPNVQIEFYVYPNRFWEWSKGKIVHEYKDVSMANLDRGVYLFDPQPINADRVQPVNGGANYRETWLGDASLFLLETKWLQPTPMRVRSVSDGKKRWDVVETVFASLTKYNDWGIDYYIDPETLEIQMAAECDAKGEPYTLWIFDGQKEVAGINVPATATAVSGRTNLKKLPKKPFSGLTFQFNIEYDEKLFERPPSVAEGPDAWRRKQ